MSDTCFYIDLGMGECEGELTAAPRTWLSDNPKVKRTFRCERHSAQEATRTYNFWRGVPVPKASGVVNARVEGSEKYDPQPKSWRQGKDAVPKFLLTNT